MRTFLIVSVLCAGLSTSAYADEASHRKAVMQLFDVLNMENVLKSSIDVMLQAQIASNPAIGTYEKEMRSFLNKYMSWGSLKEDFATLYMKSFSEAELKELLAFYKTPIGKKTITQMPQLMQQGAEIGQRRVQEHMNELQEAIQAAQQKQQQPKKSK